MLAVTMYPTALQAFNITVADHHTYFVAANDESAPVWVHNTCALSWSEDALKQLDDLLADPKAYERIAANPALLGGWKRVFDDLAEHGGDFNSYWAAEKGGRFIFTERPPIQ